MRLTDRAIPGLKLPAKGQKTYFDDSLPGFGIRVSQGGTKSFVAVLGKTRRYYTIGKYPAVSLKTARREAQRLIAGYSANPLERPTERHTDALDAFLADKLLRAKSRTVADYQRLLHRYFDFGTKSLVAVTSSDVIARLAPLSQTPSEQHHAFVAARAFYNWCVKQGKLDRSPLANLSPTAATPARDRILTDAELAAILSHAQTFTKPFGTLLQLLIYTGLRRTEAANLHRSWVTDDLLTIPSTHTKNGHPHTIPLIPSALALLADLPDQCFISPRGVIFSNWGNSKRRFDSQLSLEPWRIHDLRRTFSSLHARLGTPLHVTEKLLNHVSGSFGGVQGVYNRYDYIDEMRIALTRYDEHLQSVLARV